MPEPSLPPPAPKSPPEHPRWFFRRQEMTVVQILEREAEFLQEELKSAQNHQPASICCKEIIDFITAKSDPFTPSKIRTSQPPFRFWKSIFCCSGTGDSTPRRSRHYDKRKWESWVICLVPNRRRCCKKMSDRDHCCPSISWRGVMDLAVNGNLFADLSEATSL